MGAEKEGNPRARNKTCPHNRTWLAGMKEMGAHVLLSAAASAAAFSDRLGGFLVHTADGFVDPLPALGVGTDPLGNLAF